MNNETITSFVNGIFGVILLLLYFMSGEIFNLLVLLLLVISILLTVLSSTGFVVGGVICYGLTALFYLFAHLNEPFSQMGSWFLGVLILALAFNITITIVGKKR